MLGHDHVGSAEAVRGEMLGDHESWGHPIHHTAGDHFLMFAQAHAVVYVQL